MLGNLHVRFGVGVGVKLPGLHHVLRVRYPLTPRVRRKVIRLGQVGQAEVRRPGAGVKTALQPKIDGIGPIFHGRPRRSQSPAGAINSGKIRGGPGMEDSEEI